MEENIIEKIVELTEGNPGAISVLSKIVVYFEVVEDEKERESSILETFNCLEESNIKGSKIWIMFKDRNKGNLQSFLFDVLMTGLEHRKEMKLKN